MARDTDRKIISEALRLIAGRVYPKNQWTARWSDRYDLTLEDQHGNELNLTYSENGLLTKLVHWVPDPQNPRYASRTPIPTQKREYVLNVIGGRNSGHLRWLLTQNKDREERAERRGSAQVSEVDALKARLATLVEVHEQMQRSWYSSIDLKGWLTAEKRKVRRQIDALKRKDGQ